MAFQLTDAQFTDKIIELSKKLMYYAKRMTNDFHSEDVMQESILKALTRRPSMEHDSYVQSWFMMIIRNTAIDDYRKRHDCVDASECTELQSSDHTDIITKLHYESFDNCLKRLIKKQPYETIMYYANGYSYEEIAEIQNIPMSTVKTRIFNTRNKIEHAQLSY